MGKLAAGLSGLVGVIHFYFFYLEAFLWTTPKVLAAFGMKLEEAQTSATLAANQGVYNLGVGLALLVCAMAPLSKLRSLRFFLLTYVVGVGIFGAATVAMKIFWIQSFPAILAFLVVVLAQAKGKPTR